MIFRFYKIFIFIAFFSSSVFAKAQVPPPLETPFVSEVVDNSFIVAHFTVEHDRYIAPWGYLYDDVYVERHLIMRVDGSQWQPVVQTAGDAWVSVYEFSDVAPGVYEFFVVEYGPWQATSPIASVLIEELGSVDEETVLPIIEQSKFKYEMRVGDVNSDGLLDIFVKRVDSGPESLGTITSTILIQSSANNFSHIIPTSSQESVAEGWGVARIDWLLNDYNSDGNIDLQLYNLSDHVPSVNDLVVYSSGKASTGGVLGLHEHTEAFNKFMGNLVSWTSDPDFFENHSSVEDIYVSYYDCGYYINPYYDPFYQGIPTDPYGPYYDPYYDPYYNPYYDPTEPFVWGCGLTWGVYSVKVYDQEHVDMNALRFAQVVEEEFPGGQEDLDACDSVTFPEEDAVEMGALLSGILETYYAADILDTFSDYTSGDSDLYVNNSMGYPPFPKDAEFNKSNSSYHNYDVKTFVCPELTPGCTLGQVNSSLRYFSYPSRRLLPELTRIDGQEELIAHVPIPPQFTNISSLYLKEIGPVTQEYVGSTDWPHAFQNLTKYPHYLHPGFIARTVMVEENRDIYIFTHGAGYNAYGNWGDCDRPKNINLVLAYTNDYYGPKTFKQLDKETINHWDENR
ncbi:hypothetical protein QP938_02300 [Porticoccaceae bacterium LTM1]|nr:hypothetical protein QP938_02300 [Porticoccaceae bacterium LTM1]